MDLEKACDRVNREILWQVLRIYDVGGKLLLISQHDACQPFGGGS